MTAEFTTGDDVGRQLRLPCSQCTRATDHSVVASFHVRGDEDSGNWSFSWGEDYQIVQCLGCKLPSFRLAKSNSEDVIHEEDGNAVYPEEEALFPPRVAGHRHLGEDAYLLPSQLRGIYQETVAALSNSSPVLAGVGLRALVETICKDNQAKGDRLQEKIDDLVILNLLTPRDSSILHRVRTLGNAAAHEVKPHTPGQLLLALTIVEHLLRSVYILPAKVEGEFGGA